MKRSQIKRYVACFTDKKTRIDALGKEHVVNTGSISSRMTAAIFAERTIRPNKQTTQQYEEQEQQKQSDPMRSTNALSREALRHFNRCRQDLATGIQFWSHSMTRPRMIFPKSRDTVASKPESTDDYQIYATYRRTTEGAYMGQLKVVRKTDGRLLFPFAGAPDIGPFKDGDEARVAAQRHGETVVQSDLDNPEP